MRKRTCITVYAAYGLVALSTAFLAYAHLEYTESPPIPAAAVTVFQHGTAVRAEPLLMWALTLNLIGDSTVKMSRPEPPESAERIAKEARALRAGDSVELVFKETHELAGAERREYDRVLIPTGASAANGVRLLTGLGEYDQARQFTNAFTIQTIQTQSSGLAEVEKRRMASGLAGR